MNMKLTFGKHASLQAYKSKPVINFAEASIRASARLRSLTSEYYIRQIDPSDVEGWGVDKEMYSGLRIKQSGVDLITYDLDTQELRYFDKKMMGAGDLVRGGDGRVYITDKFLERSNQPAAFHAPDLDPENPKMSNTYYDKFKPIIDVVDEKHKQRNNDHFTLFRAKITDLPDELGRTVNIDTHTEVYTNKTLYYVVDQDVNGDFSLNYYVPTWREKGSFIPAPLRDPLGLRRVKMTLKEGVGYIEAIDYMHEHWQGVVHHNVDIERDQSGALNVVDKRKDVQGKSEVLFEEEHNLCDGALSKAHYKVARGVRYTIESPTLLPAAGFVAAASGAFGLKPLEGLFIGAGIEIAGHRFAEHIRDRTRLKKARTYSPADYNGGNTADISNRGNLNKNKPKPDRSKINSARNVVLNFEQRNCITNPRIAPLNMNPASLKYFIVNAGGMGISSVAELPHGDDIEQRIYSTGLVRTKLRIDDDHHVYFACYRRDVVKNPDKQDMPDMYKEQIGDGISIVYRTRRLVEGRYDNAFRIVKGMTLDDAMRRLEDVLDMGDFRFTKEGQDAFIDSFKIQFERPSYAYLDYGEEMNCSHVLYMSGRIPKPVDSQAVIQPL